MRRVNLPLEEKIEMAQCTIESWWQKWNGKVYVSFSGGKDSTVLLDLVRNKSLFDGAKDIEGIFCDTGLEYPEIKEFVKTFDNIKTIRPKLSFKQVIEKYGYAVGSKKVAMMARILRHPHDKNVATRNLHTTGYTQDGRYIPDMKMPAKWMKLVDAPFEVSDKCCNALKKEPFHDFGKQSGKRPFLGMKATDSRFRRMSYMKTGCNIYDGQNPVSNPLSFWTEQDILKYLCKYNLPTASVYGNIVESDGILSTTGMQRTGCMWCLFGISEEKTPNRLQILKELHPKLYDYAINDLNLKQVLEYIGVKYE